MSWELALGITGTATGLISLALIWYKEFFREKAKLEIVSFSYKKPCLFEDYDLKRTEFESKVEIKNSGNKSTTITKAYFSMNKVLIEPLIEPMDIPPNSTRVLDIHDTHLHTSVLDDLERKTKTSKEIEYCIYLTHTYGQETKCRKV